MLMQPNPLSLVIHYSHCKVPAGYLQKCLKLAAAAVTA